MKKTVGWEAQSPVKKAVGSGGLTATKSPVKKVLESYTHTYLFTYLNFDESHAPVSSHVFGSSGLELPPIDGDRHLWVDSLFLFVVVVVPGLAVAFVAVRAHEEECAVLSVVANKVCAVVESFLARPAQTKLVFVAFFFFFFVQKCVVVVSFFVFAIIPTAKVKWCILAAPFPSGFLLAFRRCSCSCS
jgi:hypothetical protein